MFNMVKNGLKGAKQGLIGLAVGDSLTFFTILLICELEVNLGTGSELLGSDDGSIVDSIRRLKRDIHKTKGVVVFLVIGVFTRTEKKEEPNNDQIHDCCHECISRMVGDCSMVNELNRHRFNTFRRRVLFLVRPLEFVYARVEALSSKPGVAIGHHEGYLLPDGA
jgi:hypothetical protein